MASKGEKNSLPVVIPRLELQQLGADKIEAARRGDPLGEPPVEVKIADPFSEEGKAQGARRRLGLPTGHTQCERRTFEVAHRAGKSQSFHAADDASVN